MGSKAKITTEPGTFFGFQAHFGRLAHVFSQVSTPVHEERSPLIESSGNNSWLNVPAVESNVPRNLFIQATGHSRGG